jgi:DNA adenine methylase
MKYMGSKSRFAKELLPIILKNRTTEQWYVEPFAGGMNLIAEVQGKRIANDSHFYLIEMWKALVNGWIPEEFTKEQYYQIKANKNHYPAYLVGWVGFNVSYAGKWFDAYAGTITTKQGNKRNYQAEAVRNCVKQALKLQEVIFYNKSYLDLQIPEQSIVYCDPPYANTRKYLDSINYEQFWDWVRKMSNSGHEVFVSEYSAPDDFTCVWSKQTISSISARSGNQTATKSTEKLFTLIQEKKK